MQARGKIYDESRRKENHTDRDPEKTKAIRLLEIDSTPKVTMMIAKIPKKYEPSPSFMVKKNVKCILVYLCNFKIKNCNFTGMFPTKTGETARSVLSGVILDAELDF